MNRRGGWPHHVVGGGTVARTYKTPKTPGTPRALVVEEGNTLGLCSFCGYGIAHGANAYYTYGGSTERVFLIGNKSHHR